MVADSDEGNSRGSVPDEMEEGFGVVDGGGVEERGEELGEATHGSDNHLPRDPAHVLRTRRPLHRPPHSPRHAFASSFFLST